MKRNQNVYEDSSIPIVLYLSFPQQKLFTDKNNQHKISFNFFFFFFYAPLPHHHQRVGVTYCFWVGSHWHQRKTSCPLCYLDTLGIVWWYLVLMKNRMRWCVRYKNDNSGFLTFGIISLCFVWNRFCVHSVTWIYFRIFWWYLVEM